MKTIYGHRKCCNCGKILSDIVAVCTIKKWYRPYFKKMVAKYYCDKICFLGKHYFIVKGEIEFVKIISKKI